MLKSAIRDNNIVVFLEHKRLYNTIGLIPEEEYTVPIGKANIVREGSDITIISYSYVINKVIEAAKILAGDNINVEILEIDPENKRISLGLKQTMANPWEVLKEKYPPGSVLNGKIKNITDFGIFVGIEDDIDGLVHISDISWKKRIKHPSEFYKRGQELDTVVLQVDAENKKFSLGIKQLGKNPWEE